MRLTNDNSAMIAMPKFALPAFRHIKAFLFSSRPGRPFNLTRVFATWSMLGIGLIIAALSYVQSAFLTQQVLARDAAVTQEFVQSIVNTEGTAVAFNTGGDTASNEKLVSFFGHLVRMPDVLASNVYDANGKIIWSSKPNAEGVEDGENEELAAALTGRLNFETGIVGQMDKIEHAELAPEHVGSRFVETYAPIFDETGKNVVGIVEVYKIPRALDQSLTSGLMRLWLSAAAGGLLLFGALYWIVKRASQIIAAQHLRLTEIESLAMIGETVTAVTHSIRNPLASIRAAAELSLGDDLEGARQSAREIISETDRVSRWTRELLYFSKHPSSLHQNQTFDLNALVVESAREFEDAPAHARTTIHLDLAVDLPQVLASEEPARHVLTSLLANGHQAMGGGGRISITTRHGDYRQSVVLTIEDEGPGIALADMEKAMRPFYSTKSGGTGLGLPLARQIMERFGGSIKLGKRRHGLLVTLTFRAITSD
jgi:two-component system, NtrC family, sensor histidine kinase HydH